MPTAQDRALALLGPLEARIMREVWSGSVPEEFVVRDALARMPELAYTTVMTTLARLASKGLLAARQGGGKRAYRYRAAGTPTDQLRRASRDEAQMVVNRYGEVALAAFAAQLDRLSPERREKLRRMAEQ